MSAKENYKSNREERGKVLVDWSTAIFAIFVGVWWAYMADSVLKQGKAFRLGDGPVLPLEFFAVIMAAYLLFFGYVYVRWMWIARTLKWNMSLLSFVKGNWLLPLATVGMVGASVYLFSSGAINLYQMLYGAVLLLFWPPMTTVMILNADRWG